MLSKKNFEKIINEINEAYYFFRIWVYLNNEFDKIKSNLNTEVLLKFFLYTLDSLKIAFLLAIAKLLDKSHSPEDKNKTRMSIDFIIEQLNNKIITQEYKKKINTKQMNKFIYSNRQLRDNRFCHNTTDIKPKIQKGPIENFFKILEWLIKTIKENHSELNIKQGLLYKYCDELAQEAAIKLFKKF